MLLLSLVLLSSPEVLDVGPPPALYGEIREAVDASSSGDVIRVQSGSYSFFGVFGKSLKIVPASAQDVVEVLGTVRVQGLDPGQTVLLEGLEIVADPDADGAALVVANTLGAVRIQDCDVRGSDSSSFEYDGLSLRVGLRAVDVADITLSNTSIEGGVEYSDNGSTVGQGAAWLERTTATFWNCTFRAPDNWWAAFGFRGSHGVEAFHSDVYVHGGSIRGGVGGDSGYNGSHGCGGDCLRLHDSVLRYRSVELDAGQNGWDWASGSLGPGLCSGSYTGERIDARGSSTHELFLGPAISLDVGPGLQYSGDPLNLSVDGPPGFATLLILGPDTGRLVPTAPGYEGDVHVVGPLGAPRRVFLGASPATLITTLPDFGSAAVTDWYLQSALVGNGRILLGPMRSITILGDSY